MENIHPIFDQILGKKDKEQLLKQNGIVIWFIGLSGSGKSTLAKSLEKYLHSNNFLTQILDGDNLRSGLNGNLGFSEEDRVENIRRVAEVAKLFAHCGVVTICSFITPTNDIRKMARNIIGEDIYFEVFVNCSLGTCEKRDVKGLYAKARKGELLNFTGIDAPFEAPADPAMVVDTDQLSLEKCLGQLVNFFENKIKIS